MSTREREQRDTISPVTCYSDVSVTSSVDGEVRDHEGRTIQGYASVFYRESDPGTQFEVFPNVFERIAPGSFTDTLERGDPVVALFNHNPDLILDHTRASLKLEENTKGLKYRARPQDTVAGRDALINVRSGLVNGSSFGFYVDRAEWEEHDNYDVRNVTAVTLVDVSPVTIPAYKGTSAAVRSAGVESEWKAWKDHKRSQERIFRQAITAHRMRVMRLHELELMV